MPTPSSRPRALDREALAALLREGAAHIEDLQTKLDEAQALLYETRAALWRYYEILGPTPTLVRYGEHAEEAARAHEENMAPLRRRIDQVLGFPDDPA